MTIISCHLINLVLVQGIHAYINLITHAIYHSSDEGFQTRATFLDISKAFGKVWLEGLIYKLRQCGFSGGLFIMGKY